jgi:3'(2'), 5'-bisphosphate nucleotidase
MAGRGQLRRTAALNGGVSSEEVPLSLAAIAHAGGTAIQRVVGSGLSRVTKPDGSPCTNADLEAESVILSGLARAFPDIPVVTEESGAIGRSIGDRFLLVDPLDGTRDFLAGRPEFTVNIALMEKSSPRAGAVYAPALGRLYIGGTTAWVADVAPGDGSIPADAWKPIATRRAPAAGLVALESLSHRDRATERFLARLPLAGRRNLSSSLKFCLVAAGEADVYARFGPTMEWDIAAGDAVVTAAGGTMMSPTGERLTYGRIDRGFRNEAFLAWGDPLYAGGFLAMMSDDD